MNSKKGKFSRSEATFWTIQKPFNQNLIGGLEHGFYFSISYMG